MENTKKVLKFEHFLNETLQGDLNKLTQLRDKAYEEISQYLQLQRTIERLDSNTEEGEKKCIKTKVDLGCNFYAQAEVPEDKMIYVCVGYGFFVNFTYPEALNFIEKKTKFLNDKADKLTSDIVNVRAQMRMVLEGLKELQGISDNTCS